MARLLFTWTIPAIALFTTVGRADAFEFTNEEQANTLFDSGLVLAQNDQCTKAIPLFLESRRLAPAWGNTFNAAFCMAKVGRYDEAMDLYEIAVGRFAKDAPEGQSAIIPSVLVQYEANVGDIEFISRYTDLSVWVDGFPRQDRPDPRRLRILPGKHTLKFARNGFEALEVPVEIAAGTKLALPIELKPTSGWLRFESEGSVDEKLQIFVDGASVGYAPWEGNFRPGPHIVWAEGAIRGTAPTRIEAETGKIVEIRLQPVQLEEAALIETEPAHAGIKFDGIQIGTGQWRVRLPSGSYPLEVSAPGYVTKTIQLAIPNKQKSIKIRLDRVPKAVPFRLWVGAFGGYAGGPTLGSGAEAYCPESCTHQYGAHGGSGGLRGGLELRNGVSIEAAVGYLWIGSWLSRMVTDPIGPHQMFPVEYAVDDALLMRGPFGSVGGSYQRSLDKGIHLRGRLHIGLIAAFANDDMNVTVSAGGESAPAKMGADPSVFNVRAFVVPELGVEWQLGSFDVGASLGTAIFLKQGTSFMHPIPWWERTTKCGEIPVNNLSCAVSNDVFSKELTHGVFAVLLPQVSIRRKF